MDLMRSGPDQAQLANKHIEYLRQFMEAGARTFRIELLDEDAARTQLMIESYQQLLTGNATGLDKLNVVRQLGVTSGTLTVLG